MTAATVRGTAPGPVPVLAVALTIVLPAAVALAAHVSGRGTLAAAVGLVQAAVVAGLAGAVHPPTARRSALVAGVAAVVADALLATGPAGSLRRLAPVLGLALVGTLAAEVTRRERPGTTAFVSATTALVLVAVAPACAVALRGLPSGADAVTVVAVAGIVGVRPGRPGRRGPLLGGAVLLGAADGALVAGLLDGLELADGVVLGLVAGCGAGVAAAVLAQWSLSGSSRSWLAAAAVPLAAGLTTGALVGRLVLG